MTSYWDRPDAQPALRARHEDRLGWSRDFFCHCGQPAVAKLIYVWEADGTEQGRSRPKCHEHYIKALDLWDRLEKAVPDAVAGLTVSVSAP